MAVTPEQVGPYRIVEQIGRGGMAVVYLARQPALGRNIALKELAPFLAGDPALAQRFIREARVAGSLSHPNVVTVFDFLEQDGVPYIAMEYLERGSLRPFVGRMSLPQIVGVLEGLLAALSQAETLHIVHRDVKPENLLVTAEGGIKIADFGIAKAMQQVQTEEMLTPAGATVGTPAYMAPEQAMAQEIGPWTDLYQTGVVAYELLTGAVPFQADGHADGDAHAAHLRPDPRPAGRHESGARGVGQADDGEGAHPGARAAHGRPGTSSRRSSSTSRGRCGGARRGSASTSPPSSTPRRSPPRASPRGRTTSPSRPSARPHPHLRRRPPRDATSSTCRPEPVDEPDSRRAERTEPSRGAARRRRAARTRAGGECSRPGPTSSNRASRTCPP